MKQLLLNLTKPLHQEVYDDLAKAIDETLVLHERITGLKKELATSKADYTKLKNRFDTEINKVNVIESWCAHQEYTKIKNIAYQQKRQVNDEYYNIFLNELITPEAFEVLAFKSLITKKGKTEYEYKFALGNRLSKHTTWVDEQKLYDTGDYYLFPSETLTGMRHQCDCEDVSFAYASLFPETTGVCYGFYNNGSEKFGHAFPVTIIDGEPFIVETTGRAVQITSWGDSRYEPYFIITKGNTFQLKSGVRFGKVASYE